MKNNFQFLAFVAFIAFIALNGCAKKEVKNINSQGKNIICFGDSITFGYGVNTGEDYPTALGRLVSYLVINAGIDGDTTEEALRRINSDILEREPLLVIIEFGGNDFLRKIPFETTMNNVKKMIDETQAKGAMVAVVDISAGMFMGEYRKAFRKLARGKGAIFIPSILSGIITNPNMKSDFMHPNAPGYIMVAEKVHKFIKPVLTKNIILRGK